MNLTSNSAVDITPLECMEQTQKTFEKLAKMFNPPKMFEILYKFNLSPKELLTKKRFNQRALTL